MELVAIRRRGFSWVLWEMLHPLMADRNFKTETLKHKTIHLDLYEEKGP